MERTYKTWGEKHNFFQNDLCEVSYLELRPQQRCSWHRHQEKYNLFFVLTGVLYIKTEWGVAEIKSGGIFTTKPGEWHEFQTHEEGATIVEVMYVKYSPEDIERAVIGGPLETQNG